MATQAVLEYVVTRKGPVSLARLATALAAVDLFTTEMVLLFANDGVTLFTDFTQSIAGLGEARRFLLFSLSAQFNTNYPTATSQSAYFRRMFRSTLSIALKSSVTASPPIVNDFTPALLTSFAWFRADRGVTLNGANVLTWTNQIVPGSGPLNVTQANPALQPPFVASDVNYGSEPIVQFTGTERLQSLAFANHPQPTSIFAVGQINLAGGRISDGTGAAQQTIVGAAGPVWAVGAGGGPVASIVVSSAARAVVANVLGATTDLYVSAAAGAGFVTPAASGNAGANGIDQLAIGATVGGGGELTGRVAEVAYIDGNLDQLQRQQLRLYVQQEYGL